jgi:hypothetical protein
MDLATFIYYAQCMYKSEKEKEKELENGKGNMKYNSRVPNYPNNLQMMFKHNGFNDNTSRMDDFWKFMVNKRCDVFSWPNEKHPDKPVGLTTKRYRLDTIINIIDQIEEVKDEIVEQNGEEFLATLRNHLNTKRNEISELVNKERREKKSETSTTSEDVVLDQEENVMDNQVEVKEQTLPMLKAGPPSFNGADTITLLKKEHEIEILKKDHEIELLKKDCVFLKDKIESLMERIRNQDDELKERLKAILKIVGVS